MTAHAGGDDTSSPPDVQPGDSLLARAVRIVETVASGSASFTASDVARKCGLPRATTHRIINELIALGLLDRDESRQLRMSSATWEQAALSSSVGNLIEAAAPITTSLHMAIQEHTYLCVVSGGDTLCIDHRGPADPSTQVIARAHRRPELSSAAGLAMLAFSPAVVQDEALVTGRSDSPARISSDMAVYRRNLADIRRAGYAVLTDSSKKGITELAVPIHSRSSSSMAALSISFPTDSDLYRRYLPPLVSAASDLSQILKRSESRHTLTFYRHSGDGR